MNQHAQDFDNAMLSQLDTPHTIAVGHDKEVCELTKSGNSNCPQCYLNDPFNATSKVVYENTALEPFSTLAVMRATSEMEKLAMDEMSLQSIKNLYKDLPIFTFKLAKYVNKEVS